MNRDYVEMLSAYPGRALSTSSSAPTLSPLMAFLGLLAYL
jgi:hypothetical protein